MSSNILFKKVATSEDVAQCTENQVVFCEEDQSIHTHSTRYGTPVITEIGSNVSDDVIMQPVQLRMPSVPNEDESMSVSPMSLSMNSNAPEVKVVNIQPGYIKCKDGGSYSLDEYKSLDKKPIMEGVYINPTHIINLHDSGILEWGLVNLEVGTYKTPSMKDALTDMSGFKNTSHLKLNNSPLTASVTGSWYVPSLGELHEIGQSFDEIQESLKFAGTELIVSYYWSSTSGADTRSAWAYNFESKSGQLGFRTSKLAVRLIKEV